MFDTSCMILIEHIRITIHLILIDNSKKNIDRLFALQKDSVIEKQKLNRLYGDLGIEY